MAQLEAPDHLAGGRAGHLVGAQLVPRRVPLPGEPRKFFASLETELIDRSVWRTHDEARSGVFDYIEVFCNRVRLHSGLGYPSPAEFERRYRLSQTRAEHTQRSRTWLFERFSHLCGTELVR